ACLGGWRGCCGGACGVTRPDENSPLLISRKALGMNNFFFEVFDVVVINRKASFERTVRHPSLAFEERDNLFQDVVKRHVAHPNASNNALASCKSAVSKPSVNQWYTGSRRSWASWRLPCCCHSRARLVAARSSQDFACWLWAIVMA